MIKQPRVACDDQPPADRFGACLQARPAERSCGRCARGLVRLVTKAHTGVDEAL